MRDPDSAKSKVKGQRVWTREPKHPLGFSTAPIGVTSQLISVPAAGAPSRKPCVRQGEGATPRPDVAAADDAGCTEPTFSGWSPVRPAIG